MRSGCSGLRRVTAALIVLTSVPFASAQGQKSGTAPRNPAAPTGSITGYVYSEESKLPLRFVEIHLVPKPAEADLADTKQPPADGQTETKEQPQVNVVSGTSGMDGSFRLDGVPAGVYFIAAIKLGYLTPGVSVDRHVTASEDELRNLIASLPTVHLGAGQTATVNLTLHRGAVIAGRMQFGDGSPATGLGVYCEPAVDFWHRPDLQNKVLTPLDQRMEPILESLEANAPFPPTITDDEGRYRISALPPGKYIVTTELKSDHSAHVVTSDGGSTDISGQDRMSTETIQVYQPGVFRRKDAKIFQIRGDEQVMDADLTIDPDGLHAVRGKILDSADGHVPRHVTVHLWETGSNDQGRVVETQDDGSFQINELPSGSYSLQIFARDTSESQHLFASGAVSMLDSPSDDSPVREYRPATLAVVVVDRDILLDNIMLTALKPGEK